MIFSCIICTLIIPCGKSLVKASCCRLLKFGGNGAIGVYDRVETALVEVHDGNPESKQATVMAAVVKTMVAARTSGELEEMVRDLEIILGRNSHES